MVKSAVERLTMGISSHRSEIKEAFGEAEEGVGTTGRLLSVLVHGTSP